MISNESRVIGPPGTGKTTELSRILNNCAKRYGSENVIALSHTRAAAAELVGRGTLVPKSNVGTIHAMALRTMGTCEVAHSPQYLRQFAEQTQLSMTPGQDDDLAFNPSAVSDGDRLLNEYGRLRNLELPREFWPPEVLWFATKWEQFKAETGTIDYTDMLEGALESEHAPGRPSALIVDEVQDSTPLQFRLVRQWGQNVDTFVCAGDADQTLYQFAGADARVFLDHPPARQQVLSQSYRVPRAVHRLASEWIARVEEREPVEYMPTDEEGEVAMCPATWRYPEPILDRIEADLAAGRSAMVMGSCGYMLAPFIALLRRHGIPFANPWRTKQGAWNPLKRNNEGCSVNAMLAFLAPFIRDDDSVWAYAEIQAWVKQVTRIFCRGGRKLVETMPQDADFTYFNRTSPAFVPGEGPEKRLARRSTVFADPEDLDRLLLCGSIPDAAVWYAEHVKPDRARAMEFIRDVVVHRGAAALEEDPRLFVGTIHSFKGAEADSVYVFPDLSLQGWQQWVGATKDAILRLFYVAFTRAKHKLTLCYPAGNTYVS